MCVPLLITAPLRVVNYGAFLPILMQDGDIGK